MMDSMSYMLGPSRDSAKRILYTQRDILHAKASVESDRPRCLDTGAVDAFVRECVDAAVDNVYKGRNECPGSMAGWQVFVGGDCIREFNRQLRARMCMRVRCDHMLRIASRSLIRTLSQLVSEHGFAQCE